jgi:hypothetical protein
MLAGEQGGREHLIAKIGKVLKSTRSNTPSTSATLMPIVTSVSS